MYHCNVCNKDIYFKIDYFSHLAVEHDIQFSDKELENKGLKRCANAGCRKVVSLNSRGSDAGLCRSCRQLGDLNPIHHADIGKLKESCRKVSQEHWKDPEYREKVISAASKPRNPEFKKQQSDRIKKWYEDNPEQREFRSINMKEMWETGVIVPKGQASCNRSKSEIQLFNMISSMCLPGRVTRDTLTSWKDKKYFFPDLVYERHILIEFFGDYWHANPKFYKPLDIVHHSITALEIWERDEKRIQNILDSTDIDDVVIIWEDDFLNRKSDEEFMKIIDEKLFALDEYVSV